MQVNLDQNDALIQITGIDSTGIEVNHKHYSQSLIVSNSDIIEHWAPNAAEQLTAEHMAPLLSLDTDIIIIGTGTTFSLLDQELLAPFYNADRSIEFMDTKAACRTFTALCSENRTVACGLIIND